MLGIIRPSTVSVHTNCFCQRPTRIWCAGRVVDGLIWGAGSRLCNVVRDCVGQRYSVVFRGLTLIIVCIVDSVDDLRVPCSLRQRYSLTAAGFFCTQIVSFPSLVWQSYTLLSNFLSNLLSIDGYVFV